MRLNHNKKNNFSSVLILDFLCKVIFLISILHSNVFADVASQNSSTNQIIISEAVDLNFNPLDVYFFYRADGASYQRIKGSFTSAPSIDSSLVGKNRFIVGALIQASNQKELYYHILIVGEQGSFYTLAEKKLELSNEIILASSLEQIKIELEKARQEHKSWNDKMSTQNLALKRLREDASVIGDLARIIDVQQDIERTKVHLSNLEKDLETLQQFVKASKNKTLPKNMASREVQLTAQLSELAQAAKSVENTHYKRKNGDLEEEIHQQIALIESTRYDSLEQLQGELAELKRRRLNLENELGKKPTVIDNAGE